VSYQVTFLLSSLIPHPSSLLTGEAVAEKKKAHDLPRDAWERLNDVLGRFEDDWQEGRPTALEEYVAAAQETERWALLIELVHEDLERRLSAGEAARVEGYLERFPELRADPEALADLVAAEFARRRKRGSRCTADDYYRRFPQLAGLLRRRLDPAAVSQATQSDLPAAPGPPATPVKSGEGCITLAVVDGPHRGKTFQFDAHDTFLIGRSPQAHCVLPEKDPYFSRLHFMVEVNPPNCRLLDLKSHNGTLVNGRRVESAELHDGDLIRAGTTTLRVRVETGAPGPQAATAAPQSEPSGAGTLATRAEEHPAGPPAIPGYRIGRELGRGGMGVVYAAVREADNQPVALKTILPRAKAWRGAVERFLREAGILGELRHPHIVALHDVGEADGRLYFAMDLVAGQDAAHLVKAHGPLPAPRAVRIVLQLLDALTYAHGRGFVHRDIKPGNLLVAAAGERDFVKVTDFGLARAYQNSALSGLTLAGERAGTPAYMAPEQILHFRDVRPAADQYAAAATLIFLLTGQPPFGPAASEREYYSLLLQAEPVPLQRRRPEFPAGLSDAVQRALARRPEDRYPDVAAFAAALTPFAS